MFDNIQHHGTVGIKDAKALLTAFDELIKTDLAETIGKADYSTAADIRKVGAFAIVLRYRKGGKWQTLATAPIVSASRKGPDDKPSAFIPCRQHFEKVLNVTAPTDSDIAAFAFAAPSATDIEKGRVATLKGRAYKVNASGNIVPARGDIRKLFRDAYGDTITGKFLAIVAKSAPSWSVVDAKARNVEIVFQQRDTVETR